MHQKYSISQSPFSSASFRLRHTFTIFLQQPLEFGPSCKHEIRSRKLRALNLIQTEVSRESGHCLNLDKKLNIPVWEKNRFRVCFPDFNGSRLFSSWLENSEYVLSKHFRSWSTKNGMGLIVRVVNSWTEQEQKDKKNGRKKGGSRRWCV